ncbi:Fc.00g020070.m01.CDS01 [Cosmosporella sp. VM-42]
MDPGRRAMIAGGNSPMRRDVTSPRHDPSTRVTKSTRPPPAKNNAKYLTQDEQSRQFVADEDKFVLKQSKKKADIRVREGRAKPIDFLAFNLRYLDSDRDVFEDDEADFDIDVPPPGDVIKSLDVTQITELDSEIASYYVLEKNARNREYWRALQTLCADRKVKLNPQGGEERVVSSVSEDIDRILGPKTHEQLEALEKQIKAKLNSNEDIDTDYWEQLLRSLLVWKARAKLSQVYEAIKQIRVDQLKERSPDMAKALGQSLPGTDTSTVSQMPAAPVSRAENKPAAVSSSSHDSASAPPGTARFSQTGNEDYSQATKALYDREVARGVDENEEIFTAEEAVANASKPQWSDKYRPRKPKYFNRVQMGYDWNKYNQTHYDHDNPPPKVVQGYKFNIFYPELIDKTKAPTFKIIREHGRRRGESFAAAGEEDTCLIRFIAGPPYEDIAFRIVDREWDYSAKKDRGFKSSFDKSRVRRRTGRNLASLPAMDPPFPDGGQPPSYTNPLLPAGQQSSCVSDFTAMESYYTLSSAPQDHSPHLSEASSLPSASAYQTSLPSHDVTTYASMTLNPRYPLRSQHIWPSPPLGPEEFDNYSYHGSPTCGSSNKINCYNPSPVSPRTWSSPDQGLLDAFQQQQQQEALKSLRICTPISTDEFPSRSSQISTPFTSSFSQSFEGDQDGLQYNSPLASQDYPAGTFSCTASPSEAPLGTPIFMASTKAESPLGGSEVLASPQGHPEARRANETVGGTKGEEPYAQLIYQAFMSRPDHSLTLQEIYQWFRDNTDKTKSGTKGWQNSIRHNLSMNAAFIKRDKKVADGSEASAGEQLTLTGEPKRSTEWVLQPWAARDGVQSTTRYRKGNTSRRAGSKGMHHHHSYHHGLRRHGHSISTKALSGRKSGCSSNKSKLRSQHYNHETTMSPTSHHRMMPQLPHMPHSIRRSTIPGVHQFGYDNLGLDSTPHMMIKPEHNRPSYSPLTPEVMAADEFGMSMPEPSLAHPMAHGYGATYATGADQSHMYVGPSLTEFPYGTGDVTGVYQPEHHHSAGGVRLFVPDGTPMQHGLYGWSSGGGI